MKEQVDLQRREAFTGYGKTRGDSLGGGTAILAVTVHGQDARATGNGVTTEKPVPFIPSRARNPALVCP